jgi:hypothetical protein
MRLTFGTSEEESLDDGLDCGVCQEPIAPGTGYIGLVDAREGGYPREGTPKLDDEAYGRDVPGLGRVVELQDLAAILRAIREPRIQFRVVHRACDTAKKQGYWFGVERASALEDWVGWVIHLDEKTWMGRSDLTRMLELWFRNRGLPRPQP